MDLIRNVQDAQHASKLLVDHALARFSTDNLSCMVIRLDSARLKNVVNNKTEPIGVEGDPATNVAHGMSEADKIVEGARKSMANAGITDSETLEQIGEETLQKMANKSESSEAELYAHGSLPSVDILASTHTSQGTK